MIEKKGLVKFFKEKENFLQYKNIDLKKLQNLHFSKGVSQWFFVKNWDFFIFCFLCKMHREKPFGEVLEKKKTF